MRKKKKGISFCLIKKFVKLFLVLFDFMTNPTYVETVFQYLHVDKCLNYYLISQIAGKLTKLLLTKKRGLNDVWQTYPESPRCGELLDFRTHPNFLNNSFYQFSQ